MLKWVCQSRNTTKPPRRRIWGLDWGSLLHRREFGTVRHSTRCADRRRARLLPARTNGAAGLRRHQRPRFLSSRPLAEKPEHHFSVLPETARGTNLGNCDGVLERPVQSSEAIVDHTGSSRRDHLYDVDSSMTPLHIGRCLVDANPMSSALVRVIGSSSRLSKASR